jgi:hypothetical protein
MLAKIRNYIKELRTLSKVATLFCKVNNNQSVGLVARYLGGEVRAYVMHMLIS